MASTPIIVALDFADAAAALNCARQLDPKLCRVKVGKELFTHAGPALVQVLQTAGFDVFLDLKFHDIPNTVAGAVKACAHLGVWMCNVHAMGGRAMMSAAADALANLTQKPLLIAVTVLTSHSAADLSELGFTQSSTELAERLGSLALESGLDGVVCSGQEAPLFREKFPNDFRLVTPGIRPAGSAKDDQTRITTPSQALSNGSDYLVIGRPITRAENPGEALRAIVDSLMAS